MIGFDEAHSGLRKKDHITEGKMKRPKQASDTLSARRKQRVGLVKKMKGMGPPAAEAAWRDPRG